MKTPVVSFLIILLAFIQLGCAEVEVRNSVPQIESPEVVGKTWGFGFSVGTVTTHKVTLSDSGFANDPFGITPRAGREGGLYGGLHLGILKNFQLGWTGHFGSGQSFLKGQYQFLGDPFTEANKGNLSASVFVRSGGSRHTKDVYLLGEEFSSKVTSTTFGYGLSVGYRFDERLMVFGGYAADHTSADAELIQETNANRMFKTDIKGHTQAVGVGLQVGTRASLRLNLNYLIPDWDEVDNEGFGTPLRGDVQFNAWF